MWGTARARTSAAWAIGLPSLLVGVLTWHRRWVSDDGYINVRVVQQLAAGNGPTFNLSERVEVGTSTLWLALVTSGHLVVPDASVGQVMVGLGTAFMVSAMVLLGLGALHLAPSSSPLILPLGTAALAGISVFWDFGTSGLETSLTFLWIAGCLWGLSRRWARQGEHPAPAWQPWPLTVAIGLGVLVRPDLAIVSVVFAVMLLAQSGRRLRDVLAAAGIALALPLAYEVFRMGYYASLVPNTALAKANGSVSQGLRYVADYVLTYHLYIPAIVVLGLYAGGLARSVSARDRGQLALWLGPLVASAAHASFVVYVGGDFMHGRFLLPATILALAPVAVVGGPVWVRAGTVLTLGWAVVAGLTLRPAPATMMITDERSYYAADKSVGATTTTAGWATDVGYVLGRAAAQDLASGASYLAVNTPVTRARMPTRTGVGVDILTGSLGVTSVGAGLSVTVTDTPALSDPVGSHLALPPEAHFRVGHALKPEAWAIARYGALAPHAGNAQVVDARAALACGDFPELVAAVSEPLTPERFWNNVLLAPRLTFFKAPADPAQARAELCGSAG